MQPTRRFLWSCALPMCLCCVSPAHAQKAVYRCDTGGRVSYSNEPCVGAKEIDATPTQGMDKMTGTSRKGADVQRHEHDTAMADALKPLTGMNAEQFRVYKHRMPLSAPDKAECARLDYQLPDLKQRAAKAPTGDRAAAEVDLYKARKRFNDLNC
ncbi:DUF4124 domain-containing protein [Acidovorax sp. GBBC 3334]|uniref:DUF4124 domain-containing protein n=1 Tax=Acidovorax sp. GBBC 3334 TaxID=2940496 RepID=UPI002303830C|nr:DUF4124 domain-containing protein [Acidovorax sp. GBBC 3334]MDA8456328.1 DUF4124 domain-containing protein [Acidovorax sp. GBBC 3334]